MAMQAELTEAPGYKKNGAGGKSAENQLNGKPNKTLWADQGLVEVEAPRSREGESGPQIVPKHQRQQSCHL
jgi:transposase-like protein